MIDTNEEQPTMPQATKSSKVNPMTWTWHLQRLVYVVHPQQSLTTPLDFVKSETKKPSRQ
jgi:hypothetical protein